MPTCETMLNRSRPCVAASGASCVRMLARGRMSSAIWPDLIDESRSLVEREAMGEVMVSAGSAPTGPDKKTVAPDIISCSSDLNSISVSPMRTISPGSRRTIPSVVQTPSDAW